jgi:hypothetical protein
MFLNLKTENYIAYSRYHNCNPSQFSFICQRVAFVCFPLIRNMDARHVLSKATNMYAKFDGKCS